jgi:hypothetical protein
VRRPASFRRDDPLVEVEIEAIVRALRQQGPLETGALRAAVDGRHWGPGRFRAALARARRQGRVRRVNGRRWAAPT